MSTYSIEDISSTSDRFKLYTLVYNANELPDKIAYLKSQNINDEIARAHAAAPQCGGELLRIEECQLPQSERKILIPVIRKVANSEDRFPRNYSAIQKKPLV